MRRLLKAAVLAAASVSAACGGDAFTAGSGGGDAGGMHDAAPPPGDTGPLDAPSVDAVGEPPSSCTGGFACVPAVPTGWSGPLELYAGSGAPPACTTGFAESVGGFGMLQAPAATCGCACGASNIDCSPAVMSFYDTMPCSNVTPCATVTLQPNVCTPLDEGTNCNQAVLIYASLTAGPSTMGDCAPQPARGVPPYTWGTQARGCVSTTAPAQVDCASGQICAPQAEPGFSPKLCISHAGDVPCPGSGYGFKHLFYTSVNDTRGCTMCTCGTPSGGSCDFSVDSYVSSDGGCSGGAIIYGPTTSCAGIQQPGDYRLTITPTAGTCAPGTSSPTGTATPTGPLTVCCPF